MKRTLKHFSFILSFLFVFFSASAQIKLPAIISDSMVLQQQTNAPIWGWALPNEKIFIKPSWSNQTASAFANSDSKWLVKIKTPKPGGPYTITITGNNTIILKDVMIGEVWICSGQSNMQMSVQQSNNAVEEIQHAQYPSIRLFTVKNEFSLDPKKDVTGSWSLCSPESVAGFSAVAYYFGRELHQRLNIAVGLINTSWGGTVAEAWTSSSALRKLGDFDSALNSMNSINANIKELLAEDERKLNEWNEAMKNVKDDYAKEDFNDADWKTMALPTKWEAAGEPDADGIVWFRKVIDIPSSWTGKNLKISLGPIDDDDITWFNEKEIGRTELWNANRLYNIPAELVKAGKAVISIRVTDTGGGGGLWGEKNQLKIYLADTTTQDSLSLVGNWHYKIDIIKPKQSVTSNANTPSVLFNGMISPLIPYAIKGAIWYQGESNVGRAAQYEKLFPAMISDWRTRWNEGDFPFYFVQIAPYKYSGDGAASAALRDAQRKSLSVTNTGMAVTLDVGNNEDIHPKNKQDVGKRLALWALSKNYGKQNIVYSGPLYKNISIKGNRIIVFIDYADDGLILKANEISGFEIAGSDENFVPAHALVEGSKVILHADKILQPTTVRYAWSDTAEATLFNKAGLPASSFTSEK